jgi:alpha-galactosidase
MAIASHVTAVPNHQTGRETSLKFRFDVAMTGRLGFELDPADLNKQDIAFCKQQLKLYKEIRPVIQLGDLYRLRSPYETNDPALMYLHEENGRQSAILFAYLIQRRHGDGHEPIRMKGLKPDALYSVSELGTGTGRRLPLQNKTVSGELLMNKGLSMAWPGKGPDYQSRVIRVQEVDY